MARLKTESISSGRPGMSCQRISGFSDGELNELKSMAHEEAVEALIDMLNTRNNGEGTAWACGYGIYGVWFDNEYAYVNIGSSCD